jgi:pimeloyl-ACP methyl ester carboxylesterase
VLVGFSMGGQVASIALARNRGVFDAFLGIEGIYDMTATWKLGASFRATNPFVDGALDDIEAETGGTPDTAAPAYAARNPVDLAPLVARSGAGRIVLVHAKDDGLALYSFAQDMVKRLKAAGKAPRLVTIGASGPNDEPDTSLAETLGQPRAGAGHAPDYAVNHVTVRTALKELAKLVR